MKRTTITGIISLILVCLMLEGCAVIEKRHALTTESLLSAAGFRMYPADTPEKLEHIKSLPQRKMVVHNRDGKNIYTYADAEFAKAIFVGDEKAYQEYNKLLVEKKIAEEKATAAEDIDEMKAWYMFGPDVNGIR